MIDVHAAVVAIHDANLTGGKQAAIRATTEVLADCWDDCADANNLGDRNTATNPYRLALEMTLDGPHAPRVEFVDEPDATANPEHDDRLRHVFITSTDDAELIAMQIVVQALDGLEARTQQRIVRYVSERIA